MSMCSCTEGQLPLITPTKNGTFLLEFCPVTTAAATAAVWMSMDNEEEKHRPFSPFSQDFSPHLQSSAQMQLYF